MNNDLWILLLSPVPVWQLFVCIAIAFFLLMMLFVQFAYIGDLHDELNQWYELSDALGNEYEITHHTPEGWDHVIPAGVPSE